MNETRFSIETKSDADLTGYFAFAAEKAARYYKLLPVLLVICSLFTLLYVHLSDPIYTAEAAITPPKDALLDSSGLQSMSGIASITKKLGFGGPSNANEDLFDQYTRVLRSYRLADVLTTRPDFLALAFPESYDPATGHLRPRGAFMGMVSDTVKAFVGLPLGPSAEDDRVFHFVKDNLSISTPHEGTTDISEVSFRFRDRQASERILEIVLKEADSLMRADKRADIAARIAYLKVQLATTTFEDQRSAIISLLTMQQNTMMVITADHRYASYVVEPPHTPQKATWPDLISVVALILFLTFALWCAAIFLLSPHNLLLRTFSRERRVLGRTGKPRKRVPSSGQVPQPSQSARSHLSQ